MNAVEPLHVTALCLAVAALLLAGGDTGPGRARLLLAGAEAVRPTPWRPPRWPAHLARPGREWICLPAGLVLAVAARSPLPLLAGAAAVPLVRRRLRAARRSAERGRRAEAVIALVGAVAAELRAGLQPGQALLAAAATVDALGPGGTTVAAAARFGGNVPEALREAARAPGADGLVGLAACWRVTVDGGAGLAAALDRLEAALRAERDQHEELRAQLAGARSTIGLLALLPAFALAMGWALGAEPLRVLLRTPAGLFCLAVGGALEAAGLWWAARIVRAVPKPPAGAVR
ncbi:type II secretion system F family protein [Streptomyces yaizuensis]|uniref:Type II secretion system F family protein n=1 Tax=Streptomyces yaizuensis TaxID=2989713 RepID=A0ABQ5P095_9ACTN|nr:type II secretion system F family protein [Streptomyces sp. YSPA8]GLF96015.1 type II secretion system F family protein [Streptomyces sp. YSPA8]